MHGTSDIHFGIREYAPTPYRRYWYDLQGVRHIGTYAGSGLMRSDIDGCIERVSQVIPCPTLEEWQAIQKLAAEVSEKSRGSE